MEYRVQWLGVCQVRCKWARHTCTCWTRADNL